MSPVAERHGLGLVETPQEKETVEAAVEEMEETETCRTTPCSPLSTSPQSKEKETQGEVEEVL